MLLNGVLMAHFLLMRNKTLTVIGGSGSGSQSVPPIIYVADLESPSSFFKKLQP